MVVKTEGMDLVTKSTFNADMTVDMWKVSEAKSRGLQSGRRSQRPAGDSWRHGVARNGDIDFSGILQAFKAVTRGQQLHEEKTEKRLTWQISMT
jgi:hypothetical protein